jgi:hypothetical protein
MLDVNVDVSWWEDSQIYHVKHVVRSGGLVGFIGFWFCDRILEYLIKLNIGAA